MTGAPFQIRSIDVADEARRDEQLGTKAKFWFDDAGVPTLFKRGRPNEDWSEKAAAECAGLLGLPHAGVELAECRGAPGIISPSFLEEGDMLLHGNEVLLALDPNYPIALDYYKVAAHTLDAVFGSLQRLSVGLPFAPLASLPPDFDARDVFTGYLMLDAWIGNGDRHYQNWGIVNRGAGFYLAVTYDHASSLGRNETAGKASVRLSGRDPLLTVAKYAVKSRSALYASPMEPRPMTTLEAFRRAAQLRPAAGAFWRERLRAVEDAQIRDLFARFPPDRPPPPYGPFAIAILAFNRSQLLLDVQ